MRASHRWKIAASVLPLFLAGLATVSAHGPESHIATDARGDVRSDTGAPLAEPRADVIEAGAAFSGDQVVFRLKTAEPVNPMTDPSWASGLTALAWAIDTTGDTREEFQVEYGFDPGSNKIYADVYPAGVANAAPACAAAAQFANGSYTFSVPAGCIGSPDHVQYAALMLYTRNAADPNAPQGEDRVPDGSGNFAGPVHKGGSAPAPAPEPAPQPAPPPAPAPPDEPTEPTPPPVYVPPDYGDDNPSDPTQGYWLIGRDGGIFSFGTAPFHGSIGNARFPDPIVAMAAHPSGEGYWFADDKGGIFSFGQAAFWGSTSQIRLTRPIVGMAASPSGRGYWLVASDGGVFAFGDAPFLGSTGNIRLNRPIVGMAPRPSGQGYWMVASDGGVFAFGDAPFFGSTAGVPAARTVALAPTADGNGYRIARTDGGVTHFGNASNRGSMAGRGLGHPLVGIVTTR